VLAKVFFSAASWFSAEESEQPESKAKIKSAEIRFDIVFT
jgi:hypothetical protein